MEAGIRHRQCTMTIMQQIEDLKNWHKQQEKLFQLSQTQNQRGQISCTTKVKNQFPVLKPDELILLDSVEIPTPAEESDKCHDEIPIKPSYSDFNQLLDQKIADSNERGIEYRNNCVKPTRKFLKKGEGIARFGMPLPVKTKQRKKEVNSINNENKVNKKKQIKDSKCLTSLGLCAEVSEEAIPHSWKNILGSMLRSNHENSIQSDSNNLSLPDSFLEKIEAVGKKNAREQEEVKVFEMLEQRVLDSSFCSSSSVIMKLMENSVKSTPIKEKLHIKEHLESNQQRAEGMTGPQTENQHLKHHQTPGDKLDESLHVRFREENSYKSFRDYSDPTQEENYYGDDKEWSEDGRGCDCSTDYSSSDEDTRPPDCPSQGRGSNTVCQNAKSQEIIATLKHVECKEGDVNRYELMRSCGQQKLQDGIELQSQSSIINIRLKELEDEIEIFRKENAKLKKLHSDFEQEYKLFKNDKKVFYSQIDEERRRNIEFLEEEKQKLIKEKLVFEKYTKNLNKNPNKEERKEIQILKEQLATMKEELAKKESRWGMAQARVRNQVKLLEDDNKKLKQEIEEIRKQSQKINVIKSDRKSNTHLLHAISQQLTKISTKDIADTFAVGDRSKPNRKKQRCERIYEPQGFSSDTEIEIANVLPKANSVENEIIRTIEEAMFEPVEKRLSQQNPIVSDKSLQVINGDPVELITESVVSGMQEVTDKDGNEEIYYNDGRKEIRYKNGNVKKISPNGDIIKVVYFNGDVKEVSKDGKVKYYYVESRIWHTTYPDGLEVVDFPSGQVERRHVNGMVEVLYPNQCKKLSHTDGSEEWTYEDGTVLKVDTEKQKILTLPNGQREIHTKEHKRREYPDGTVKLIYPDGIQETRYSNGRIRLKDSSGNLVMDSG